MDKFTACEQAYKNGYDTGKRDVVKIFTDNLINHKEFVKRIGENSPMYFLDLVLWVCDILLTNDLPKESLL